MCLIIWLGGGIAWSLFIALLESDHPFAAFVSLIVSVSFIIWLLTSDQDSSQSSHFDSQDSSGNVDWTNVRQDNYISDYEERRKREREARYEERREERRAKVKRQYEERRERRKEEIERMRSLPSRLEKDGISMAKNQKKRDTKYSSGRSSGGFGGGKSRGGGGGRSF